MRLTFEDFDGRGRHHKPIIDQDTGKKVGEILSGGSNSPNFIRVSLFDGRYEEELYTRDECKGFIKGVEAVLNHILDEMLGSALAQHKADAA
jgi:hypothetical protein